MDDDFDARLRQALRQRAEQVGRPDDVLGEIRRRSARRRRRQHLAASVGVMLVVAVPVAAALPRLLPSAEHEVVLGREASLEVEAPPPGQTVEVPPRGQAHGATFDDGTPVLVVHDGKGHVRVFDARSPLEEEGRRGQLGWCATYTGGRLLDPLTDRRWDPDGTPVQSEPPGPRQVSPAQLVTYEVHGGPDDAVVEVGQPGPVEATPRLAPEDLPPAPEPCSPSEVVTARLPGEPADVADLDELPDGTYHVSATLEQVGDDPARLCAIPEDVNHLRVLLRPPRPDRLQPPLCDEASTETIEVPGNEVGQHDDPDLAHVRAGRFGVSVHDGKVYRLTIPASNMRPRSVPVDGEVVLAGWLQPPGPDRGGGPPSERPSGSPSEPERAASSEVEYAPSPPDHPVPLPFPLVDRTEDDDEAEAVALTTDEVVDAPGWFTVDSGARPEFWLPLDEDVDIAIEGGSVTRDAFVSRVDDGGLDDQKVALTVDRASGRVTEVREHED